MSVCSVSSWAWLSRSSPCPSARGRRGPACDARGACAKGDCERQIFRATADFDPTEHSKLTRSLFDPATKTYPLERVLHGAGLHAQNAFTQALFKYELNKTLAPDSPAPAHARARLRACRLPDATILFNVMSISDANDLTNLQMTFTACNLLGIHHPFIASTPCCHPRCPRKTPEDADNPLSANNHRLAYHHITCAAGGLLKARHNTLAEAIAEVLTREAGFVCELRNGLSSALTSNAQVDIVAFAWFRSAKAIAIDVTVSNPMLPSYINAAYSDALAIFKLREKEKDDKHGPGCKAMNRDFMAAVFSTFGGMHGVPFLNLFTLIFAEAIAADRAAGGTGWAPAQRKVRARETIAAVLARGSAQMASLLPLGQENPQHVQRPRNGAVSKKRAHNFF